MLTIIGDFEKLLDLKESALFPLNDCLHDCAFNQATRGQLAFPSHEPDFHSEFENPENLHEGRVLDPVNVRVQHMDQSHHRLRVRYLEVKRHLVLPYD